MSTDNTLELEELAANAWPAPVVQVVDGWRLRFGHGFTGRANSVWPNVACGPLPLADKLDLAEAFYADRRLPARFQMCAACAPPELDAELAARGYARDPAVLVQTAAIGEVLARVAAPAIAVAETFDDAWLAAWLAVSGARTRGWPGLPAPHPHPRRLRPVPGHRPAGGGRPGGAGAGLGRRVRHGDPARATA